ncbi:MAG: cytochrome-c oxidase, cbb3-type subunit III [Gammaproteobacteria bacterium]|nr:cytochrome-c oxidase, cbb3-type subunit III [Gammaproteobacteria bacterium]MDH5650260.1 cytochrome-c oxidase, cbb3-type subunit III [Gammaproteobacteria bacterium]
MSTGLSIFVIVFTLANIVGCYFLIRWSGQKRQGEAAEGQVTGHTWDGDLQEYNNPLPRWWLWLFYITIIFSLVYLVFYPGAGNFQGVLGWSQEQRYNDEIKAANADYGPIFAAYSKQSIQDLAKDKKAMQAGQRLFLNYCATCHGSDARGAKGFPNLSDTDWLYGGSPDAIKTSILNGRNGIMPPMGAALGGAGIDEVTAYVMTLSGREADPNFAEAGKQRFQILCASCHGQDAKGNPALGAANLTDDIWLHGRSRGAIVETITKGRTGVMPPHRDFLGEDKAHLLAAYVYSLSNK